MNIDEITAFRDGRPEVPPYDPAAKARLHLRLADAWTAPAPRPHRFGRRRLLTVGALTATLAVGITLVQNIELRERPAAGGHPPRPLVLGPVANAESLARNAAAKAADQPDIAADPTRWAYVKRLNARTRQDGGQWLTGFPKVTTVHEQWRRLDDKGFAFMEDGRLKTEDESEFEVAYPDILSLPTDPAELLARVYEEVDAEAAARGHRPDPRMKTPEPAALTDEERNTLAFQYIGQCMRDAVLPSRLRAAMYGAMAKIPGVRYEAGASDLAKRPGVTLYRLEHDYLRDEIFVDSGTYEYLGYRTIAVRDHDDPRGHISLKKGEITGWDALLRTAVVDRPGERP
ncbi:CU044_5270 family protein [Sphaerisporangium fuscum]|uniref:CU044_5270 family protein n=1 Tax=Sphaerisporangium fuscum TaxID=2835868 RepID=UPI001BDC6235|nr:CU044_5270 family protein [Sphaerisporangium fuscum]